MKGKRFMKNLKRFVAIAMVLVLTMVMFAGCSKKEENTNTPETTPAPAQNETTATPAPEQNETTATTAPEQSEVTTAPEDSTAVPGDENDFTEWVNERPDYLGEDDTVAAKVEKSFMAAVKENTDVAAIASEIGADSVLSDISVETDTVNPGYLNGFDGDILNFTEGAVIMPFISSIPFVAYVFKANDTTALFNELSEKVNLRWNVCTEADEMRIDIEGDYVFVVLAPWEF